MQKTNLTIDVQKCGNFIGPILAIGSLENNNSCDEVEKHFHFLSPRDLKSLFVPGPGQTDSEGCNYFRP